jgi:predicted membrane channel-forming protein YqfA (hemolysin III family)
MDEVLNTMPPEDERDPVMPDIVAPAMLALLGCVFLGFAIESSIEHHAQTAVVVLVFVLGSFLMMSASRIRRILRSRAAYRAHVRTVVGQ